MSTRHYSRREVFRLGGASVGALAAARLLGTTPAAAAADRVRLAADGPAVQLARVWARSDTQRAVLARMDATHLQFADGSAEFLLWPGDLQRLRQVGVDVRVLDADVLADRRTTPAARVLRQPGQTDGEYRMVDDYVTELEALVAEHGASGRCRLVEMAHTSLHGRRIVAIEIGAGVVDAAGNPTHDGRPTVVHDGMHHCREWPAGEMPMMWAYDLLEGYGDDPQITHIVDNARTLILPLVNPDGFRRSRESPVQVDSSSDLFGAGQLALGVSGRESYWRKNLRSFSDAYVDGVTTTASDAHGIDLNRNYPFLWGDERGSSSVPEDQTYRGAAPLSEPECLNVRDLTLALAPITHITHHTSGELMLYAWGRDPRLIRSPDYTLMGDDEYFLSDGDHLSLGWRMEQFNGYDAKQAFGLYPTSGTSRDYGHASVRSLIYTFEHGREFHGPYESTIPAMYEKNRGAFIAHANAAIDPRVNCSMAGRVLDAAGNPVEGVTLRVVKDYVTPTAIGQEAALTTEAEDGYAERLDRLVRPAADGSFTVVMPPSTRPYLYEREFGGEGYDWDDPAAVTLEPMEGYTLVAEAPDGRRGEIPDVRVNRGDHITIGAITVR